MAAVGSSGRIVRVASTLRMVSVMLMVLVAMVMSCPAASTAELSDCVPDKLATVVAPPLLPVLSATPEPTATALVDMIDTLARSLLLASKVSASIKTANGL